MLTGLVFFAWGEIYSLFPSICTDTFGAKYASANAGMLYTAKGTAALLVPLGAVIVTNYGWTPVFYIASGLNIAAALAAWFILKPARIHCTAAPSMATTSKRQGGGLAMRCRNFCAANISRRRLVALILAAAPPCPAPARRRTSTKTKVPSGSRITRSISPPRACGPPATR